MEKSIRINKNIIKYLSLDVFDTILLRNSKPELQRFYEVSVLHNNFLKDYGYNFTDKEIFFLRYICHRISYNSNKIKDNENNSNISNIFNLMKKNLNIKENIIKDFIEIELEYEKNNLKLNIILYKKILRILKEKNLKLFFISDMYLSASHIKELLENFTKNLGDYKVYSSSDFNSTKSSGSLFKTFIENEKIDPRYVLHIGDNYNSDYLQPLNYEFKVFYSPRTISFRINRGLKEKIFLIKNRILK
jgi:predicted HAD superfamily hydrolase